MAGRGHLTLEVRAEVKGDLLAPEIRLFAGDTPVAAFPVDVLVRGREVQYLTRSGDVVGTVSLDQHLACPTCGHPINNEER